MAAKSNQWMLFGFDLSKSMRFLRLGLHQLLHDQASWLPSVFQPLLWVKVAGQWEGWRDTGRCTSSTYCPAMGDASPEVFYGANIPSDLVLFKRVQIPESEEAFLDEAIDLEVAISSPFSEHEQIAGWKIVGRDQAMLEVVVAISSQDAAQSALDQLLPEVNLPGQEMATVCALYEDIELIEFHGFGGVGREQAYLRAVRRSAGLIGAIAIASCMALALPVLSSVYRSARLADQYESIKQEALAVDRSIESLHLQRARLSFILEDVKLRPDYASRLEGIAATAPDGTFLEGLRIEDSQVEVTGYSDNAANYLRLLTEQERYTNVNARSAFLREPRSGLERFTIDWSFVAEER